MFDSISNSSYTYDRLIKKSTVQFLSGSIHVSPSLIISYRTLRGKITLDRGDDAFGRDLS